MKDTLLKVCMTIMIFIGAFALTGCSNSLESVQEPMQAVDMTLLSNLMDKKEHDAKVQEIRDDIETLSAFIESEGETPQVVADDSLNEIEALEDIRDALQEQKDDIEARKAAYKTIYNKGKHIADVSATVPTTASGFCAAWVAIVYQSSGYPYIYMDADDMYWAYCDSSDRGDLMPGMIIAVPSHTHSSAGYTYGHVGIIVNDGGQWHVRHSSSGRVLYWTLDRWISYYGTTYTPKWGFAANALR